MPNLTPEIEADVRAALKAKIEANAPEIAAVFPREVLITSKSDFFDKCGKDVDDDIEVRFCRILLTRFEDSLIDGCEDNPVTYLVYDLPIEFEFKEREDDTNSHDDFVKMILNLRNSFLDNRYLNGNKHTEHSPLTFLEDIVSDGETITATLQIKVTCV